MISETITISNKLGLHARASSKLVMLAGTFDADIKISKDDKSANAKSIMGVMMLSASKGSSVTITVDGNDEINALHAIVELINNKFGETE